MFHFYTFYIWRECVCGVLFGVGVGDGLTVSLCGRRSHWFLSLTPIEILWPLFDYICVFSCFSCFQFYSNIRFRFGNAGSRARGHSGKSFKYKFDMNCVTLISFIVFFRDGKVYSFLESLFTIAFNVGEPLHSDLSRMSWMERQNEQRKR